MSAPLVAPAQPGVPSLGAHFLAKLAEVPHANQRPFRHSFPLIPIIPIVANIITPASQPISAKARWPEPCTFFPHKFPHKMVISCGVSRKVLKGAGRAQMAVTVIIFAVFAVPATRCCTWQEYLQAGGRRFESCTAHQSQFTSPATAVAPPRPLPAPLIAPAPACPFFGPPGCMHKSPLSSCCLRPRSESHQPPFSAA